VDVMGKRCYTCSESCGGCVGRPLVYFRCVLIICSLQDQERNRRMMARLYVRLEAQKNPPSVTTHVTHPSASDVKSTQFNSSSTILDGQHLWVSLQLYWVHLIYASTLGQRMSPRLRHPGKFFPRFVRQSQFNQMLRLSTPSEYVFPKYIWIASAQLTETYQPAFRTQPFRIYSIRPSYRPRTKYQSS
jgi:hypothetical protein